MVILHFGCVKVPTPPPPVALLPPTRGASWSSERSCCTGAVAGALKPAGEGPRFGQALEHGVLELLFLGSPGCRPWVA